MESGVRSSTPNAILRGWYLASDDQEHPRETESADHQHRRSWLMTDDGEPPKETQSPKDQGQERNKDALSSLIGTAKMI